MKKLFLLFSPFFLYVIYGVFLSQYRLRIQDPKAEEKKSSRFYDYRGGAHVHGPLNMAEKIGLEIIDGALGSSLDFLVLNDLNSFKEHQTANYYEHLLVFRVGEYSHFDSRVLFYQDKLPLPFQDLGQSQIYFNEALDSPRKIENYLAVLAHPFKKGFEWTRALPTGLNGIEFINLNSLWAYAWRERKFSAIWSLLIYPFNSHLALFRLFEEPIHEMDFWQKLIEKGKTFGMVGMDATSRALRIGNIVFRLPSYNALFGFASNHVLLRSELTGNAQKDRGKILDAIGQNRFYIGLDIFADPKGFEAIVTHGQKVYPMGSEFILKKGMVLKARLPFKPIVPFEVVILKDGQRYFTTSSQNTALPLTKTGNYQIVVKIIPTLPLPDGKKWFPWIYTNAFYVR